MKMQVRLTTETSPVYWGENALLSIDGATITLHIADNDALLSIQKAARRIDNQGIHSVKLIGPGWSVEQVWAFWQGYRNPKNVNQMDYSLLTATEQQTIEKRLHIIDWVRETINQPAAELGPRELAQNAVSLLESVGKKSLNIQWIEGDELDKREYVGLYNVGKGSQRPPVFLSVDYNPSAQKEAPVFACLVGKGITFDSGGYSLKTSQYMDSMKADMGGAALVTGALALAIAQGLKKRVKLYLCCADNLVSGNAFKLGDVLRYRNGKSVEIMNTDAEGRLVLADGLIDASADKPTLLIDCATLTGAAKTAVGNDYHSVLSFDDKLVAQLLKSAQSQQEAFWRLPLADFHRQQLPSNFADLNNIAGAAHSAGASTAAAFLSYFVENYQTGWLHIDCSATYRKSAVAQWAAGATGIGVRTLAHLLLNYSAKA